MSSVASSDSSTSLHGTHSESAYRRALKHAVVALCSEIGFQAADDTALESLTEMLQSYMTELGRSSKAFCELAGRTDPLVSDVVIALVEMGQNITGLTSYAHRSNKVELVPPTMVTSSQDLRRLQVGGKKNHPPHIPEHLPAFPDQHTYIRTLTHKPPISEYQIIREKAAAQKRDVERALTRFIAKTGDTENLFPDDPYAFPLIANKPKPLPYLDALLSKDQDWDALQEEDEKWAKQQEQEQRERQEKEKLQDSQKMERTETLATQTLTQPGVAVKQEPTTIKQEPTATVANPASMDVLDSDSQIDNPYLRPIKMPKYKASSKKYK